MNPIEPAGLDFDLCVCFFNVFLILNILFVIEFCVYLCFGCYDLVVSTSAIDCLERPIFKMCQVIC